MNEKIGNALKELGLPVFYIQPGNSTEKEYIVFNYSIYPGYYADNEQKCDKYTILINLYCSKSVNLYINRITDCMLKADFALNTIASTQIERMQDGSVIYNTALIFKTIKEREWLNE